MGILFTGAMGFLLTATMGFLFTMTLGIQLTVSRAKTSRLWRASMMFTASPSARHILPPAVD
jgi:hypothetical protein